MTDARVETDRRVVAIVAARDEADRIAQTLAALKTALPGVELIVADDASQDATAEVAMLQGASVVSRGRPHGKGANMTAAAHSALPFPVPAGSGQNGPAGAVADHHDPVYLLCDGDLGGSAGQLDRLVFAVVEGECDLAVASFARRVGGGLGLALSFARWSIRRRCGARVVAPISGQRALSAQALESVLPFAPGYGMEIGMTVDAVRAGYRLGEYELDLEHRATGRSLAGFLHRGRQLIDFLKVHIARR